jgi:hypothetical protein
MSPWGDTSYPNYNSLNRAFLYRVPQSLLLYLTRGTPFLFFILGFCGKLVDLKLELLKRESSKLLPAPQHEPCSAPGPKASGLIGQRRGLPGDLGAPRDGRDP